MPSYKVNHTGFLNMNWRVAGEEIDMSEREAKYLAAPYGDRLTLVEVKKPARRRQREAAADE